MRHGDVNIEEETTQSIITRIHILRGLEPEPTPQIAPAVSLPHDEVHLPTSDTLDEPIS